MKINNNIQALNAYRNLHANQFNTSKNLEKLSSGLRINRAADDAAGLAISEKMRSQIRGLKQAERNSMDGISLMQTSEGAMQEVHAMLQRMRELAVQAANDTNTQYDREQIQKEIDQLKLEIDSISEKTEFNTRKLLNGSSAVLTVLKTGATDNATNLVKDPKVIDPSLRSGEYQVNVQLDATNPLEYRVTQPAGGLENGDISFTNRTLGMMFGEYTIEIRDITKDESGNPINANVRVYGPDGRQIGDTSAISIGSGASPKQNVGGLQIDATKISRAGTAKVNIEANVNVTLNREDSNGVQQPFAATRTYTTNNGRVTHGGIEFQYKSDIESGVTNFSLTNNALAFQIGPNTDQRVMIDIPQMNIVELGIEEINVTTHHGANEAIFQLDQAINKISEARSKLGATQNRLEHTINNLQVTHENLTASESRIRDADMALEMTQFIRNNIINQAATAMLAQANQLPQGVLQLLQ